MKTVTDFILGGSKITVDYDYSHGTKRCLLLGRKAMTNLDCILKSRDKKKEKQRHYFADKGSGNPLQYSCLENPMDGGAW